MSCPVVRTITELYGSYEYDSGSESHSKQGETKIMIPSGICGGGSVATDISMETVKFYITLRKLQFARAELAETQDKSGENSQSSEVTNHTDTSHIIDSTDTSNRTTTPRTIIENALNPSTPPPIHVYFARMFKDYYGQKSSLLLKRILTDNKIYTVLTRAIDIIDIAEGVCASTHARDFPSGMSIPTIYIDPDAVANISKPENIYSEINKIIDYANKLCVGNLKTSIEKLPNFDKTLREFTFPQEGEQTWKECLDLDMEIATYAFALENYHCSAIKKLNEVMNLCQSIIDLTTFSSGKR